MKPIKLLNKPLVAAASNGLQHQFNEDVANKINELVDAVNSIRANVAVINNTKVLTSPYDLEPIRINIDQTTKQQ